MLHLKTVLPDCRPPRRGGRKKNTFEERDAKKMRESSESEGEGDESGREWLTKFSTMKVGPQKHIKPVTEPKCLCLGARVTAHRVTSRPVGLEVKKRLKKLHEYHANLLL